MERGSISVELLNGLGICGFFAGALGGIGQSVSFTDFAGISGREAAATTALDVGGR